MWESNPDGPAMISTLDRILARKGKRTTKQISEQQEQDIDPLSMFLYREGPNDCGRIQRKTSQN
jgi:hypothetical protein